MFYSWKKSSLEFQYFKSKYNTTHATRYIWNWCHWMWLIWFYCALLNVYFFSANKKPIIINYKLLSFVIFLCIVAQSNKHPKNFIEVKMFKRTLTHFLNAQFFNFFSCLFIGRHIKVKMVHWSKLKYFQVNKFTGI